MKSPHSASRNGRGLRPELEPLILRRIALALAAASWSIAVLSAAGWAFGNLLLASISAKFIPMAPSTIACLVAMSCAVAVQARLPGRAVADALANALSAGVVLWCTGKLLEAAGLLPWGLLEKASAGSGLGASFPVGVMSPVTAAGLLLDAVALMLGTANPELPRRQAAAVVSVLPAALGFIVVLGYASGTPLLAGSAQIPVALTTGLALFLVSIAILFWLGGRVRPLASFIGDSVRARLMRALIPLTVAAAFAQGSLQLLPQLGNWNPALLNAAVSLAVMTAMGMIGSSVAKSVAGRIEQAQHAERLSRTRLAALVEQLPDLVAVHKEGRLLFANPALVEKLGLESVDALLGRPFLDLLHPDDREYFGPRLEQLHGPGPGMHLRAQRWLLQDGSTFPVEVTARQISFDDGLASLVVARDVTERARLEQQLRQASKMDALGKLAGGVAHDFNNLITVMLSFGKFVQEDLGPGHPSREDVQEVIAAAHRAAALTRQLLAFSRSQEYEPQEVDLAATVRSIEPMLRRLLGEDIDLVCRAGEGNAAVRGDPGYIEQLVMNLAVNARDAMPGGGKLTVETSLAELDDTYVRGHLGAAPGPYVLLAVSDSGVGMDEQTQARIFEPFFTTKAKGKGTGLGLSTVFGIVKQMGGDISVYSSVGRGSTFKVYLPRLTEELPTRAVPAPSATLPRGSETILLVEDEESVRAIAARSLRRAGYQVLEAPDPDAALRIVQERQGRLDLLLTDVVMPSMHGGELVHRIQEQGFNTPVLYMSGYTGGALAHQGVFADGAAYLQKPFTPAQLTIKVRSILDSVP